MLGFNGTTSMDDTIRADLSTRNLGGVILMGRNCSSPAQIAQLTAAVKSNAATAPFIGIDQEGGLVARLTSSNGYTKTISAYQLGTVIGKLDSTSAQAARMAGWLSSAGITTDFAPVADVDVNPSSPAIGAYGRSFSPNPLIVAANDSVFIDRFREKKVMTCLKHFPGHGSAGTDSHFTLPDITTTWADSELIPYQRLLASGRIDMVMVGHLYNALIDSVYPTSLSRNTVNGLLRTRIGYGGVVITDDLYNMKAITDNFGFVQAAALAINAGVDILLYVYDLNSQGGSLCRMLVDSLEARVLSGNIPQQRIDDALAHISALKQQYITTAIASGRNAYQPVRFGLGAYPNPFNPSTTVEVRLAEATDARIAVFDILGREVGVIFEGVLPSGTHHFRFDAGSLSSGAYFVKVATRSSSASKAVLPLMLVR
jgi:beta-N-acetylhexosaminidase